MSKKLRVTTLTGSAYDRGYQHGERWKDSIRYFAENRVGLVAGGQWSGGFAKSPADIIALAEQTMPHHEAYAPDLVEEMRGMADATGLSMGELIIVSGFTDFIDTVYGVSKRETMLEPALAIDDCTAFIVPDSAADGAGFFGQTWDMHEAATEHLILLDLQPEDGPNALVMTAAGCLGQIGMNEHGIAIGINNLMGADGGIGVTWPFVVRKVLQQDNIDDALKCITDVELAGAHNYLLFDKTGRGYNIEAMSTHYDIVELEETPLTHTNHCLVPETIALAQERHPDSQSSSENRLAQANDTLADRPVTIEMLQEMTAEAPVCTTSKPPFNVETCGAAIMRPKTGDFWGVWGLPSENEYEHFSI